jgi:hypothetical protein
MLRLLPSSLSKALGGAGCRGDQRRFLNIHEYQGAQLMSKFGINVPDGAAAQTVADVVKAAEQLKDSAGEVCSLIWLMQFDLIVASQRSCALARTPASNVCAGCAEKSDLCWRSWPWQIHERTTRWRSYLQSIGSEESGREDAWADSCDQANRPSGYGAYMPSAAISIHVRSTCVCFAHRQYGYRRALYLSHSAHGGDALQLPSLVPNRMQASR